MKTLRLAVVILSTLTPVTGLAQTLVTQTPPSAATTGGLRLACFSPQRAFSDSAAGKAAIARLASLRDQKGREIEDKNKALAAQEQALQTSGAILTEDVRARRTQELEKFRIDVDRFIQDAQAEITGVQRDLETAFLAQLRPALDQVVKSKGVQIVLNVDSDSIAWFDPSLDITGDVVRQLARLTPTR